MRHRCCNADQENVEWSAKALRPVRISSMWSLLLDSETNWSKRGFEISGCWRLWVMGHIGVRRGLMGVGDNNAWDILGLGDGSRLVVDQCTAYIVYCTPYSVRRIVYVVHCILYAI